MKLTEMLKERYNNLHNKNECNVEWHTIDFLFNELINGNKDDIRKINYISRVKHIYCKLVIRKRRWIKNRRIE